MLTKAEYLRLEQMAHAGAAAAAADQDERAYLRMIQVANDCRRQAAEAAQREAQHATVQPK